MNPSLNPDRFSWNRIGALCHYYGPRLRKQMIIYFCVSLIASIITLIPAPGAFQVALFTMSQTALQLMYYMAPVVLAKNGDTRIVDRLLPATSLEKFLFLTCYFIPVTGALTLLLPLISSKVYMMIPAVQTADLVDLLNIRANTSWPIQLTNIMGGISCVLTCLYVVVRSHSNRTLKGVLSVFGVEIAIGILGAIWGMSSAFMKGFHDGYSGVCPNNLNALSREETNQIMHDAITGMTQSDGFLIAVNVIIGGYMLLMFILNYRVQKKMSV